MNRNRRNAHAGEFWSVNSRRIAGHPSLITKKKKNGNFKVLPTTHASRTRNKKNIRLFTNPNPNDTRATYVLVKLEDVKLEKLGKYKNNFKIIDSRDKSIIRNIKKRNK